MASIQGQTSEDSAAPAFDPSQPHEVVAQAAEPSTAFDPAKGYDVVSQEITPPAFDPNQPHEIIKKPTAAPAATREIPKFSAMDETSLFERGYTKLRESLSPLIGETRAQGMQRQLDQQLLDRDLPGVGRAAQESAGPKGDTLMREGFIPAAVNSAFTPAPGTPQFKMKAAAPGAGKLEQVGTGVTNVAKSVVNSMASPGGVAVMLGGAPAKMIGAILTPILAKHAAENLLPTIGTLADPNKTVQQKAEAATGEVLSLAGAGAGGRAMLKDGAAAPSPAETSAPEAAASEPLIKSARDSAAVFEGKAPEPSLTGEPAPLSAKEAAEVFTQGEPPAAAEANPGEAQPEQGADAQAAAKARTLQQFGRIDPATMNALARTTAGAALGYYSGDTPEERIRNATIGALAGLGAPKMLSVLRGGVGDGVEVAPAEGAAAKPGSMRPANRDVPPPSSAGQPPSLKIGEASGTGTMKTRGFVDSVQASPYLAPETKALVTGMYETKAQKTIQQFAGNLVDAMVQNHPATGMAEAKAAFLSSADSPTAESWAVGLELARRFAKTKDYAQESDILNHISKQATTPARALAQLATLDKYSTEAIGLYLERNGGKLTPAARSQVDVLKNKVDLATNPEAKLARQMELWEHINDQLPKSAGEKLARGLPLALIFHTKVFVKKALGDATMMVLRTTADNIVPAFDSGLSVLTGTGRTRTWVNLADQFKGLGQPVVDFMQGMRDAKAQGAETFPSIGAGVKTMATLAKAATRSAYLDNGLADVRAALGHTYSSRVLRAAEDAVTIGMGIPTRAAYMRAYQSRIAMEMKTAAVNGAEVTNPSPDMIDRAHLAGMEATFSHDNPFSTALKGSRKVLNFGQPIGIGSAIAPLSKVPGGVVDMGVRYSPLGFVRAAYKGGLAKVLGNPEAVDRGQALDAFTQAALGTVGLAGTGYWLAKNGIITGAAEENRDAEAVRQASGFAKYSVNLSALKRMMVTGQWDRPDPGQIGDVTMPYTWAQPIGLGLATGAEVWHQGAVARRQQQRKGIVQRASAMTQGMLGTTKSLEDMELFQGMSRLAKDVSSYDLLPGLALQSLNLPAMYVPSMFRDARNLQDNTVRQLAVSDRVQAATNKFLERIPFVADKMGFPPMRDRFGDAVKRYDIGSNGWANVLLNPTYLSTIKANPAGKEVMRLWENTGTAAALPGSVPMSMQIHDAQGNKQDVQLTPQQISDMQHWEGNLTRQFYTTLMQHPRYATWTDDQRSKVLGDVQTAVHAAGKMLLLGDVPLDANKRPRRPGAIEQAVIAASLQSAQLSGMTRAGPFLQRLANRKN